MAQPRPGRNLTHVCARNSRARRGGGTLWIMTKRAAILVLTSILVVLGTGPGFAQLSATPFVSGLSQPLVMVPYPGRSGTFLVAEQSGRIRVVASGTVHDVPFLDLRDQIAAGGEQGLLGLALAPDFSTSGRFFVNFTNRAGHTVIARFRIAPSDPLRADPATRFDLVWPDGERVIRQPFSNHNGGHLAFGPDGYLYIGMGDGGSGNDPGHVAQDPRSLLGKMLRLNVSVPDTHPRGYEVPADNPFAGRSDVLGEIWSFGLRNPWRWSFDAPDLGGSGALLIADVGQNAREEINFEPRDAGGRNYGWRNREGTRPNVTDRPPYFEPLTDPIYEYGRDNGQSITGGYVYRGRALGEAFGGRYFFGDFARSRIWSFRIVASPDGIVRVEDVVDHSAELGEAASRPASFAIDDKGELYILGYGGTIYRIVNPTALPPAGPAPGAVRPRSGGPVGTARPR
jgi:glucose/arabinose dehydrogenase